MKRIPHLFLAALLCVLAPLAYAAVVGVTWDNATTNVDGSAIPASGQAAISTTVVEYGVCGPGDTFTSAAGQVTAPGSVTAANTPDLPPGRWCLRAKHVNGYGVESDWTGAAVKVVDAPKPNPPQNFSAG